MPTVCRGQMLGKGVAGRRERVLKTCEHFRYTLFFSELEPRGELEMATH